MSEDKESKFIKVQETEVVKTSVYKGLGKTQPVSEFGRLPSLEFSQVRVMLKGEDFDINATLDIEIAKRLMEQLQETLR